MTTRRDFHKLALGALVAGPTIAGPTVLSAQKKINSTFKGVTVGAQSYSFRDLPLDEAIAAMVKIGIGECELFSGHVEPKKRGAEMTTWRETVDLDEFKKVREKFDKAGIVLYAYNYSFRESFTDKEIERGFEFAKTLGCKYITASSTVPMGAKLYPYAEKHGIVVAMHGHSNMKDGEFASPESFAKAMEGRSKWIKINLDIGHFWAANFNPMEFIDQHHADIVTIHIKDRKKDQGGNFPFGEGDTPIVQVLHQLRDKKYKIPANIEYEYKGAADSTTEVGKCFEYCKKALLS